MISIGKVIIFVIHKWSVEFKIQNKTQSNEYETDPYFLPFKPNKQSLVMF